ncbi:MAG: hypothetical protein RR190_05140 [Bacteroidales bacterium]
MKTKFFTLFALISALFIVSTTNANAQEYPKNTAKVKYQGEIMSGFGFGIGEFAIDRVYVHTIQGVKIGRYFSTGLGIGVNIIPLYVFGSNTEVYMPIYVNAKGYLPLGKKSSLYLSFDLGGSFGVTYGAAEFRGFMCMPAVGVSIVNRVNISFGYELQRLSTGISGLSVNMGALAIKLGVRF